MLHHGPHVCCFLDTNQGCISFHVYIMMTEPLWFRFVFNLSHPSWVLLWSNYRKNDGFRPNSYSKPYLASRRIEAVTGTLGKLYRDHWNDRISSEEHVEMTGLVLKLSNARILICHHVCMCYRYWIRCGLSAISLCDEWIYQFYHSFVCVWQTETLFGWSDGLSASVWGE